MTDFQKRAKKAADELHLEFYSSPQEGKVIVKLSAETIRTALAALRAVAGGGRLQHSPPNIIIIEVPNE